MARWRKALSLALAFAMMLGMFPFEMNANADGDTGPYTITWKNGGSTVYSTTANKDDTYEYAGPQPEKTADAAQTWVFTGWKDDADNRYYASFPKASRDVTYNATFESSPRQYTVAFVNYEGEKLSQTTYAYNTPASSVATPAAPAREPDALHTYTFTGWELANGGGMGVRTVTEDAVYRPAYAENARLYTVTWKNENGTTLGTGSYQYGQTPTYTGATPTKAGDTQYTYSFIGWEPSVTAVTGDVTYTAAYGRTLVTEDANFKYTVKWVNDNGSPITQNSYKKGVTPTQPAAPSKDSDERYDYTFAGWTPTVAAVTTDAVYTAQYGKTERTYTLKYTTNGTVLETVTGVKPDEIPAYTGAMPTKPETQGERYLFAGWLTSIDPTESVITRTAKYVTVKKQYPVVFVNDDGKVLQVKMVEYGATPGLPATTPTKAKTEQYDYTFDKWTPDVQPVDGGKVYTAAYTPSTRDYLVTFVNWDGTQLMAPKAYPYGTTLDGMDKPANPTKPAVGPKAYEFKGWSETTDTDAGTTVFTAQFVEKPRTVTILWKNDNGSILEKDENLPYSESTMPSYDGATPEKTPTATVEYTFNGWAPALAPTTDDATYTAQYSESARKYEIKWMNGTELLRTDKVAVGETPAYAGDQPTQAPDAQKIYTFTGWDPAPVAVTDDATYTAQFSANDRYYTITYAFDTDQGEKGVLATSSELYDEIPTYSGAMSGGKPYKAPTAQYTYTFTGWDETFNNVSSEKTYTAHFSATLNKYTIQWVDGDGYVIQTDYEVPYGATPAFTSSDPEKSDDAQGNQYTWNGAWKNSAGVDGIQTVTGDETYTAQFTTNFKIEWVNYDNSPLATTYVPAGQMPSYPTGAPTPTRPHDNAPTYRWAWDQTNPWDPAVVAATAPATYTAQFVEQRNEYSINWNYPDPTDGSDQNRPQTAPADDPLYKPDDVPNYPNWQDQDGNPYIPGQLPTKDTTYVPVFNITWDNPTEDDFVDPVPYKQPVNKKDDKLEDSVENQPWVDENGDPYTPHNATKPETFKPAYNIDWNYPDPTNGDTTDPTKVPYDKDVTKPATAPDDVTWVNKDDPTDVYDPANPQKPTKDKTYVPQYTITWGDPDQYKTPDKVAYKQPVTVPDDTTLPDNVKGKPWVNKDDGAPFTAHTADKDETYQPLFTITWKPENTTDPDKVEQVKQGVTPAYGANPTKSGYNFSKWDPTPYPADKDQTYTAQYNAVSSGGGGGGGGGSTKSTVPITWVVNGNKTTRNVPKGDMPVYPNGTPTKDGASFVRWTPEVVPAKEPATYTAVFTDSPNYHARPDETGVDKMLETGEHVIYYRGYPDGTIKPYGNITRHETAMIFYRLLLNKDVPITKSFKDVPEESWYTTAVLTLASLGIVTGDDEGNFRPADAITRAEFTAICVRFVKAQEAHFEFTDVSEDFWAYEAIMTAAYYGWITGYPDGSFRPNAYIARCEAAAVVNRVLGRAADKDYVTKHESELIYFPDLLHEWYYYEMVEGTNAHDYDIKDDVETWKRMYDK